MSFWKTCLLRLMAVPFSLAGMAAWAQPPKQGDYNGSLGYIFADHPRNGSDLSTLEKLPASIGIWVLPKLRFGIANDTFESIKAPSMRRVTGIGETKLDLTWLVKNTPTVTPAGDSLNQNFKLDYVVKLPTANRKRGLGTGEYDHQFQGIFTKDLDAQNSIEIDAGDYMAGRPEGGFKHTGIISLIGSRYFKLHGKLAVNFELDGATHSGESPASAVASPGLSYDLNDAATVAWGVSVGLTPYDSRIGAYVTLQFKGNVHK